MTREAEARQRRLRKALLDTFDTGNALMDAWEQLTIEEDTYHMELALMGEPEIEEREIDGEQIMVLLDWDYYRDRLKAIWLEKAEAELDAEEAYHGNRRQ